MAKQANPRRSGLAMGLTQPDTVLPSQHFRSRRKQAPEQRLMSAVLQDALDCVEKHRCATDPRGHRLFQEAKQWLLAGETEWPYSFEYICRALDLDPNAVRQHLGVEPEQEPTLRSGRAQSPPP